MSSLRGLSPSEKIREWIWLNFKIGCLSFGGSGRILLFQEGLVDELKWLSFDEFQEMLTIAQVLPGPNLVNVAAYAGFQITGTLGAIGGLIALCLPGALLAVAAFALLLTQNRHLTLLMQGFSIASVSLFLIFIIRMIRGLKIAHSPTVETQTTSATASTTKIFLRSLLALLIAGASYTGFPLPELLPLGMGLGLLLEFTCS